MKMSHKVVCQQHVASKIKNGCLKQTRLAQRKDWNLNQNAFNPRDQNFPSMSAAKICRIRSCEFFYEMELRIPAQKTKLIISATFMVAGLVLEKNSL